MVLHFLQPVRKMCVFEAPNAWKYITIFTVQFLCCCFFTCHNDSFLIWPNNKIILFLISFSIKLQINFWISICFWLIFLCLFIYLSPVLGQLVLCCSWYSATVVLQSGIPNNMLVFPGTTKKLHQSLMSLWIIVNLLMLFVVSMICYKCITLFLSMHLFRSAIAAFGKSLLNMLVGIKLLSLPVSILYLYSIVLWLPFVFIFATITDLMHESWIFLSYCIEVSC